MVVKYFIWFYGDDATVPDFSNDRQKSILNQLHIQLNSKPACSFFNLSVIVNGLFFLFFAG